MRYSRSSSPFKSFAIIVLPFLAFVLGWHIARNNPQYGQVALVNPLETIKEDNSNLSLKKNQSQYFDLEIVNEVYELISEKYVDEDILKDAQVEYGLARGIVSSLDDPYSQFMSPKENKDFQDSMEGKLEGIGAELTMRDALLTVVSPLKNSPASNAGIMPEDVISKINGETTEDLTLEAAVKKIRGKKGTNVILTILRLGEDEQDITITRDEIKIDSVTWEMKENQVALISLNQFGEDTTKDFNNILDEVLLQEAKAVILDLRFNGGGYLDGAVDIVSSFIENGEVVKIKKRNGLGTEILEVTGDSKIANMPLVVMINKGSASASEIVAGALQDYKRAHILGEQSFGKGTVQEVIPLSDGSSLRLTIARWFTPHDQNISHKGITPDQEVEMSIKDYLEDRDPQLDAALEYLKKEIK